MELFKITPKDDVQNKQEQVAPTKTEFKLIGTFIRTPGLILYGYNQYEDILFQVIEHLPTKVRLVVKPHPIHKNRDIVDHEEFEYKRCDIDARYYYFEALNLKTDKDRISQWKQGKKELCNLRPFNPDAKIAIY